MGKDEDAVAAQARHVIREGAALMGLKLAIEHSRDLTAALAAHRGELPEADAALWRSYLEALAGQLCECLGPKGARAAFAALDVFVKTRAN